MKLTVKARFKASKESFEKFGEGMYLIYLPYEEDEDSPKIIAELLSRKMGVPPSRVEYAGKDPRNNYIFELI